MAWVLCICVLPSTQILDGMLPGSRCGIPVCVDVSFLEPACWVACCMCVCVCVNVGCYLFLGIGWLSCLRQTDAASDRGLWSSNLVLQLNQQSRAQSYRRPRQTPIIKYCQNKGSDNHFQIKYQVWVKFYTYWIHTQVSRDSNLIREDVNISSCVYWTL